MHERAAGEVDAVVHAAHGQSEIATEEDDDDRGRYRVEAVADEVEVRFPECDQLEHAIFAMGPAQMLTGGIFATWHPVVVPHAGTEVRGEDRRDEADAERDCEALDRARCRTGTG